MRPEKITASGSSVTARFEGEFDAVLSVIAIGNSPINLVVVTKIAERAGLHTLSLTPSEAIRRLPSLNPVIVVVDGGADNRACDELADALIAARRAAPGALPKIVFLSVTPKPDTGSLLQPMIDAVVAKPITPERLQPVLTRFARALA